MGFFSWKTQDTNRSICNRHSKQKPFTVYMINPLTKEVFKEDNYDGRGVFGGKDYYSLVAEINGKGGRGDKQRDVGIDLVCPISLKPRKKKVVFPVLVENLDNMDKFDGSVEAEICPYNGFV